MSSKNNSWIPIIGRLALCIAGLFLLLFFANVRSRLFYQGPNYNFLFWIFLYCTVTGVGLMKFKRWAILLLFLPGVLTVAIFVYSWTKGASVPMPWALLNYGFVAVLFAIPAFMLRSWHELQW
jgi:hypothetical protein